MNMRQSGEQRVERELFCIYHIVGKNDEYKEIKKRGRFYSVLVLILDMEK